MWSLEDAVEIKAELWNQYKNDSFSLKIRLLVQGDLTDQILLTFLIVASGLMPVLLQWTVALLTCNKLNISFFS